MNEIPTKLDYKMNWRTDEGRVLVDLAGPSKQVTTWVVDTCNECVRRGLIELGWTPPDAP